MRYGVTLLMTIFDTLQIGVSGGNFHTMFSSPVLIYKKKKKRKILDFWAEGFLNVHIYIHK